jgi:hypothetical protein
MSISFARWFYLTEAAQINWTQKTADRWTGGFRTPEGSPIFVEFDIIDDPNFIRRSWLYEYQIPDSVDWENIHSLALVNFDASGRREATGAGYGTFVFATVLDGLRELITTQPIDAITFSAYQDADPRARASRQSLYEYLAYMASRRFGYVGFPHQSQPEHFLLIKKELVQAAQSDPRQMRQQLLQMKQQRRAALGQTG